MYVRGLSKAPPSSTLTLEPPSKSPSRRNAPDLDAPHDAARRVRDAPGGGDALRRLRQAGQHLQRHVHNHDRRDGARVHRARPRGLRRGRRAPAHHRVPLVRRHGVQRDPGREQVRQRELLRPRGPGERDRDLRGAPGDRQRLVQHERQRHGAHRRHRPDDRRRAVRGHGPALRRGLQLRRAHDQRDRQSGRGTTFRAAAVLSGTIYTPWTGEAAPIGFFVGHGVSDPGNLISTGRAMRDVFLGVNGCANQTALEPAVGSESHVKTVYQNCSKPVTFIAFDGVHQYSPLDAGASTSWVPRELWSFFFPSESSS